MMPPAEGQGAGRPWKVPHRDRRLWSHVPTQNTTHRERTVMSRMNPRAAGFLTVIVAGIVACGGSDAVDPTQGPLEALPVTSETVIAAVELLSKGPLTLPSTCEGSPAINCSGGVAGNPMRFSVTRGPVTATEAGPNQFTFATDVVIASLENGSVTMSGVTCSVGVNTALGTSQTVHIAGTASFVFNNTTGLRSRLHLESEMSGLEDADVSVAGSFGCDIASFFKPVMLTSLSEQLATGGDVCGAPGPALLKVCTEAEVLGSRASHAPGRPTRL